MSNALFSSFHLYIVVEDCLFSDISLGGPLTDFTILELLVFLDHLFSNLNEVRGTVPHDAVEHEFLDCERKLFESGF